MCEDCHCCPILTIDKDGILLEDDFGGRIKLTKEQFTLLKEKIQKGEL